MYGPGSPILLLWGKCGGVRKSLVRRLLQTPGSNGGGLHHSGNSGDRRKQMYSGYILEKELADFANALNPGRVPGSALQAQASGGNKDAFMGFWLEKLDT